MFADVLAANEAYAREFRLAGLEPRAAKRLAVLTCIDSRIEPLQMSDRAGDAKILRNAGAGVTDDVVRCSRSLVSPRSRPAISSRTRSAGWLGPRGGHPCRAPPQAGGPDTRASRSSTPRTRRRLSAKTSSASVLAVLTKLRAGGFLDDVDTGRLAQLC